MWSGWQTILLSNCFCYSCVLSILIRRAWNSLVLSLGPLLFSFSFEVLPEVRSTWGLLNTVLICFLRNVLVCFNILPFYFKLLCFYPAQAVMLWFFSAYRTLYESRSMSGPGQWGVGTDWAYWRAFSVHCAHWLTGHIRKGKTENIFKLPKSDTSEKRHLFFSNTDLLLNKYLSYLFIMSCQMELVFICLDESHT